LGGSVHTIKKNTEALVAARKEIGLAVDADKIKYTDIFRDQNVGRSLSIKNGNNSSQMVGHFKYLGTTLTTQNSINEELRAQRSREYLLSFGAESFVFQFGIKKYKD